MMFKCPVCKGMHTVNNNYDNKEFICQNGPSRRGRKTFQDQVPEDILTQNSYNWNRSSTKEDVTIAATINVGDPKYRPTGEKIGQIKKNY